MNNLNYSTIMMVATLLVSSAEASSVKKDITRFVSKNGALIAGALAGAVVGVAVLARKNSTQKTTPPKSPEVIVAPKKTATAKTTKPAKSLIARSKAWVKNNPEKFLGIASGVVAVVVGAKHYFASSIPSEAGLNPAEQPQALVTPSSNQTQALVTPSSTEPQAQSGNGTTPTLSTEVTPTPCTTIAGVVVAAGLLGCLLINEYRLKGTVMLKRERDKAISTAQKDLNLANITKNELNEDQKTLIKNHLHDFFKFPICGPWCYLNPHRCKRITNGNIDVKELLMEIQLKIN